MDLVFPTTGRFESVKSIKKILLVFPGPAPLIVKLLNMDKTVQEYVMKISN